MNFVKRAFRYVTRTKVKTILLMVTFFLIGNLVILGLGISTAADNAKVLTRKQMRAIVNYEVDYDAWYSEIDKLTDEDEINEAYSHYPTIDDEIATKLGEDQRVSAYNYMVSSTAYSSGFDNVPVGNEDTYSSSYMMQDENGDSVEYKEANLKLEANQSPNMIELAEGTFEVIQGNFYSQNDVDNRNPVCLITKELADLNGFQVGDTITFSTIELNQLKNIAKQLGISEEDLYLNLTICGIYTTTQDVDPNSQDFRYLSPYSSPKNVILMPITTYADQMTSISMTSEQYLQSVDPTYTSTMDEETIRESISLPSKVTYLLEDPLEVDAFVSDHSNMLGQYQKLDANNETFKKLARPLDTLSFFANIIVWIVIINAIVIISLVTALTLKTREFEIGVLLSLGVSKFKVVLQMFLELIGIAFIGFGLAAVSGSLLAGKVGDLVLSYQTSSDAQYEDNTNNGYYFSDDNYFTEISQDDLLSQYHVNVSPLLILQIYLLGTGVVLLAIVIPSFMIMRLNPKQILLEQN